MADYASRVGIEAIVPSLEPVPRVSRVGIEAIIPSLHPVPKVARVGLVVLMPYAPVQPALKTHIFVIT